MRLSTSLGSCLSSRGSDDLLPYPEAIKILYDLGYRTVDITFNRFTHKDYLLGQDDWEFKVDEVRNMADKLGVAISQCHFPFTNTNAPAFFEPGFSDHFDECMRRSYLAAGMLGVRYGVVHPRTYPEFNHESKACLEANRDYYDFYIELGIRHKVGTVFENMLPSLNRQAATRYCQHYDQLIELVDSYADEMVGVCWDTGHANQMKFDQGRAIRRIGHRLKALHINDNHYGTRDEHVLPFMGEIDWVDVLEALVDIDYSGDLTYETGRVGRLAPRGPFQDAFLRAVYENGLCLLGLYKEIAARKKGA